MLKKAILPLLLLSLPALGAERQEGANHGGGGSDLVSQFRELARLTLDRFELSCGASRATEAQLLRGTLQSARVISVEELRDPSDNSPIPGQRDLLAWGSPGLIQLKKSSPDLQADSWETHVRHRRPLAQHILHELYRASGLTNSSSLSPDDGYQISMGECQAETWPILVGGEIESFDCVAHYRSKRSRSLFEVPGTRRQRGFLSEFSRRGKGVYTSLVSYELFLRSNPEGVLASGKLLDKTSKKSTSFRGSYFPDNRIRVEILDLKLPSELLPENSNIQRERFNLELTCEPNYKSQNPSQPR